MPKPCARGRPREWPLREVLNAIFYLLRGGVTWRLLPSDLPPRSTVFGWFSRWRDEGLFETINHLLVMADRERIGREASPSGTRLWHQGLDQSSLAVGQISFVTQPFAAMLLPSGWGPHRDTKWASTTPWESRQHWPADFGTEFASAVGR